MINIDLLICLEIVFLVYNAPDSLSINNIFMPTINDRRTYPCYPLTSNIMSSTQKYSPSTKEIWNCILSHTNDEHNIGTETLRKILLEQNPTWTISSKVRHQSTTQPPHMTNIPITTQRLRHLRNSRPLSDTRPNAIIIKNPNLPITSLDCLLSNLENANVTGLSGDETDIPLLAMTLGHKEIEEIGKFYDRIPTIIDWYYHCYSLPQNDVGSSSDVPPPTLIARWLNLKDTCYQSCIIIKDGPKDGRWKNNLTIDLTAVARTLWWYQASGNDRTQVYGERELARLLKNL